MLLKERHPIRKQENGHDLAAGQLQRRGILRGTNLLLVIGLLIPFLIVLLLYLNNAADAPYYDGWNFFFWYKRAEEEGVTAQFIADVFSYKYISHRIPVTHVLHMLLWKLTDCSDVMTVLALYACLVGAFLFMVAYGRREKISLVFLLPIPALIFSLKQGAMLFWAAYLNIPLLIFCAIASFYNYNRMFAGGGGGMVNI